MASAPWHPPGRVTNPAVHPLRLYWSPPATDHRGLGTFHLRAGEGRKLPVELTDVAALVARYRDAGQTDESRRLAAAVESLSAIAAEHFKQRTVPR